MTVNVNCCPDPTNICVQRCSDVTLAFQIRDKLGRPVDITADDVCFTVRQGFVGQIQVGPLTSLAGLHLDSANGLVSFDLTKANTTTDVPEKCAVEWSYEVRVKSGGTGGPEFVYVWGTLRIDPAVTAV